MKINLIEYFIETVQKSPDKTAVIDGNISINFINLDKRAKFLAYKIINESNSLNNPIAVYLPKNINAIISDIAITYSGNIYMNLDLKTPLERIKNILQVIKPKILITSNNYVNSINSILEDDIIVIKIEDEIESLQINDNFFLNRISDIIDSDPYCIINTSGSTGTPKGVVLNHKSFFDFTEWSIDTFGISDNEVIGSLSPLVFDIYSHELCMMMSKGCTIVIIPEGFSAFPFKILELLKKEKVTYIFWVPTIMVNIANIDLLSKINLPDLKMIWFAGEVFPTKQFNYWHKILSDVRFVNLYGPIEITLDCSYYIVDREFKDDESLPIGNKCRNTSLLILNEKSEPCKIGEEGELCVRGTSLAMGYYNNPEKTTAAFVQNPLNKNYPETIYRTGDIVMVNERGEIMFKGRRDTLIKHLGYRIELTEVEHIIINTLKTISNGCVVYNREAKEITLFYESEKEILAPEFRRSIGEKLPKYMIPSKLIKIDKMPMNTNGKIDRLMLNNKINVKG